MADEVACRSDQNPDFHGVRGGPPPKFEELLSDVTVTCARGYANLTKKTKKKIKKFNEKKNYNKGIFFVK